VAFETAPDRGFAVADLTPAYPAEAASLHRGIALLDRARVLIRMNINRRKPGNAASIGPWLPRPGSDWRLMDARPALTRNGRSLRVDILEPVSARFHVSSTRPPTAPEKSE